MRFPTTFTFHVLFAQQCLLPFVLSSDPLLHDRDRGSLSLRDYNAAFNLASYCMDEDGYMCALNRKLCESAGLTWKKRSGFDSEEEWQAALTEEMKHRLTPGIDGNEEVGQWHVEAPPAMKLSNAFIARLEGKVGLSLENFAISENGKQIFTVSGTATEVGELLKVGFTSLTPVPRSLKISPLLFEPVREEPQPWTQLAEYEAEEDDLAGGSGFGLEVQLQSDGGRTRKASLSSRGSTKRGATKGPQDVSTSWVQSMASLRHRGVVVEAQGPSQVSIKGLATRSQAYAVAMALAEDSATGTIAPAERIQEFWNNGGGILQSGNTENFPLWDIGIDGEGQIAGVRDGGFQIYTECYIKDRDHLDIEVEDFVLTDIQDHSKIAQLWGGFSNHKKGWHGSSCAKMLAGYASVTCPGPKKDGKRRTGIAYGSKLVLQAYRAIPGGDWLAAAYAAGARVHSNSYGSGTTTTSAYASQARELDAFMYANEDMSVFFAAGNFGVKGITSQCTMKNGICVGAIDGEHKVTGFSGRGPAGDERIKPDMLALGAQGTSAATPTLAGGAVLVRQYFTDGFFPKGVKSKGKGFIPTAALIKAVLMNSGEHVEVPTPTVKDTFPSNDQGFGNTRLSNVLVTPSSPQGLVTVVHGVWSPGCEACPKLADQETMTLSIQMDADAANYGLPLRATLTWTDYPTSASSNKALINDLDLSLELDGDSYHPNGAGEPDHLNTVERIIIDHPKPGATYTLRVNASQVPRGPQTYALVISGPLTRNTNTEPPCGPGKKQQQSCRGDDIACHGDACFHVSDQLYTKTDAHDYCAGFRGGGWGLACPVSWEENIAIASSVRYKGEGSNEADSLKGWFGYKAIAESPHVRCDASQNVVVTGYVNWANGEGPGNIHADGRTAFMGMQETGRWDTSRRVSKKRAVCQNYNGARMSLSGEHDEEGAGQEEKVPLIASGCGVLVVVVFAVVIRRHRSSAEGIKATLTTTSGKEAEGGGGGEEGIIPNTSNPMLSAGKQNVRRRSTLTGRRGSTIA